MWMWPSSTVWIQIAYYYLNTCMCVNVCVYLTQLFSASHLSEALLSRECVRTGWLANAAKGRLGAPYFSWEKSEGCRAPPLLLSSHSPFTEHTDGALPGFCWRPSLPASKELQQALGRFVWFLGGLLWGREDRRKSGWCPTCSNPPMGWQDKAGVVLPQLGPLALLPLSCFTLFIKLSWRVHKWYYCVLQSHTENTNMPIIENICNAGDGWVDPRIPGELLWKVLILWCSRKLLCVGVGKREKEEREKADGRKRAPQGPVPCRLSGVIYTWHVCMWMCAVYERVVKRSALH